MDQKDDIGTDSTTVRTIMCDPPFQLRVPFLNGGNLYYILRFYKPVQESDL